MDHPVTTSLPDDDFNARADELILSSAPDAELRELLAELDETSALLRAELDKRRTTGGLTPEQHAEIERIPEYLELTRARWSSAVTLWREFRDELRKEGRR